MLQLLFLTPIWWFVFTQWSWFRLIDFHCWMLQGNYEISSISGFSAHIELAGNDFFTLFLALVYLYYSTVYLEAVLHWVETQKEKSLHFFFFRSAHEKEIQTFVLGKGMWKSHLHPSFTDSITNHHYVQGSFPIGLKHGATILTGYDSPFSFSEVN